MASRRITITVPDKVASIVHKRARAEKKPVSRVFGEAIEETERERIRQRMIEGYIETREENRKIAEEFWPIAGETWPTN
jgi:predicted transcriptional regulator